MLLFPILVTVQLDGYSIRIYFILSITMYMAAGLSPRYLGIKVISMDENTVCVRFVHVYTLSVKREIKLMQGNQVQKVARHIVL